MKLEIINNANDRIVKVEFLEFTIVSPLLTYIKRIIDNG